MATEVKFPSTKLFKSEESERYSSLVLCQNDIEFCLSCLIELENGSHNKTIAEALWNAALVRFFSCFDVPKGLARNVFQTLPKDNGESYVYFKNYRDKHIAHRMNPVEQIKVSLNLSESMEVIGIGTVGLSDASYLDRGMHSRLKKLVIEILEIIKENIESTKREIIEAAKSKSREEIEALEAARVVVPKDRYLSKTKK